MKKRIWLLPIVLIVILTTGIVLKTRYVKYENACQLYIDGDYETALTEFDALGSYRRSEIYYDELVLIEARELVRDEANYEQVLELLETVKDTNTVSNDEYSYILGLARQQYVYANPNLDDKNVVAAIDYLKENGLWTDSLDRKLYPWAIEVIGVNYDKNDENTILDSINSTSTFYVHGKLIEGGERKSTSVKVIITYPDGNTENLYISGTVQREGTFWIGINTWKQSLPTGVMNLEFFDGSSASIGTYSIVIGNDTVI